MILYVDETENDEYFIVTGLLVESEKTINDAYYSFKKRVKRYKISSKQKGVLFTEFKSTFIDHQFQSVKRKMMEVVKTTDGSVIYSAYFKKTKHINQSLKEIVYIRLLKNIVLSIINPIDIVFDEFKNLSFEHNIIGSVGILSNVLSIKSADSQLITGLQFADNLCSVIRMYLSKDDSNNYFDIIKDIVIQSKIEQ